MLPAHRFAHLRLTPDPFPSGYQHSAVCVYNVNPEEKQVCESGQEKHGKDWWLHFKRRYNVFKQTNGNNMMIWL